MKQQQISAKYVDHMGSDLSVVNAARTSFGKESAWDEIKEPETDDFAQRFRLKPRDASLIRFLATGYRSDEWDAFLDEVIDHARHGSKDELTNLLHAYKRKAQHFAPFAHPHLSIRVTMPIFLARQFVKHQVGGTWSEESRRYISDEPGVWFPEEWHSRPENIKQGSGGVVDCQDYCDQAAEHSVSTSLRAYEALLAEGVAPEEARTILPLNMMTTVTWTGSLLFWSRVCNQRMDSHAQLAAQELANQIADIAQPLYPVSWAALVG